MGVNILKSINEGPFQIGTFRKTLVDGNKGALHLGPERAQVYSDLSPEDKERYNADIRATNILLQGLPKDIYTLINHYTDAKDIWDNMKMLLEGSELTKEDRESQLYGDFEHFRQNKGETIHDYYVRFVTIVKLNRGLKESNYDQLYAYLKQHEAHANENKIMLERFTQHMVVPLALMYNGFSPTDNLIENLTNTLALLTQSYKTYLPQTNNQLRTSSNTRNQATVQDGRVVVQNVQGRQNRGQRNNARGTCAAGNGGVHNRVGNVKPGQARQIKCYNCNGICHIARNCTQPKRPQNLEYFKDKMLLMQAQENEVVLDEEQLLFIAGGQDNAVDEDVDEPPVQDLALNVDNVFQTDECDAFDYDVDEAPTAQTMFIANLSSADPVYDEAGPSYDSGILSEVHDHDNYQDDIYEHHEVHEMHDDVQPNCLVDLDAEYTGNTNMILYDQYVMDNTEPVVQNNVSFVPNDAYMMIKNEMHEQTVQCVFVKAHTKVVDASLTAELATYKEQVERKVAIGYRDPLYLTRAKQVQLALYNGHEIIKTHHVSAIVHNSEDTIEIAEITRKKMNDKMKTPMWTEQNINIRPPDYSKENYLVTFTTQTQLTPEQIFWSKDVLKIKAKALKEQTKASKPIKALIVNNKEVHLDYLKHLKESVETLREIVKEARVERPLDRSLASACLYTKQSQDLLEYMIGTCPKDFIKRDKKQATTPFNRKKQVTFKDQCETSNNNTQNM
nr:hypothetical protein [Tanacetum cinerariifolium]